MQRPRLIIGNKNYSSWSFRAWLALAKLGVDFQETRIPLFVHGFKEKLLRYSPAGKVPVYIDGGLAVWDSLAILEHLAEKHPALWPAEAGLRARARSVSAEMHSGFHARRDALPVNCRAIGRRVEITEAVANDIRRISDIWTECRSLSKGTGPWLFGSFSIADAMFAPVVSRFHTYGVAGAPIVQEYIGTVLNDPRVRAWFEAGKSEEEIIEMFEVGIV